MSEQLAADVVSKWAGGMKVPFVGHLSCGSAALEDLVRTAWSTAPTRDGEVEQYREALERIVQWANAYPVDIFREPDFEVCATALKAAGQTLDAVSASNMRHVVEGVGEIARAALATQAEGVDRG